MNLLGKAPVRQNGKGLRRGLGEPSDYGGGMTPSEEERKGRNVG